MHGGGVPALRGGTARRTGERGDRAEVRRRDASGDTRFRIKDDCDRDFQVEVEDLPVGVYDVFVAGVARGTIDVVDVLGQTEGEFEVATDPDDPGEVLLDFDPVGQTVEIRQEGTLFLSSTVGDPGPGTCDTVDVEPGMTNTGADADAGELLLDFDPRGEVVEVRQGGTVFLTVTMPG